MKPASFVILCLLSAGRMHGGSEQSASLPVGRLEIRADVDSALVFVDDSLMGRAPVVADSLIPGLHSIRVMHPDLTNWFAGVAADTVRIQAGDSRVLQFSLKSANGTRLLQGEWAAPGPELLPFQPLHPGQGVRNLGLYLSGGATVIAGIAAAYFKIGADGRQAAYLLDGDPQTLAGRRRFDTAAGVAFAATQLGFALFCYLLLSD